MNNHPRILLLAIFTCLHLFISWGKTESECFPYTLNQVFHELPAAFTNQFSGVTNETARRSTICVFDELPFVKTGVVERMQSGNEITLTVPLEARFSPPWTNHPVHSVNIRFTEPSGEFLPIAIPSSCIETQLVSQCRYELQLFCCNNTNAAQRYWMAPVENYGGLAKLSFYDLPNGANESVPVGTNGWGIAFWVDLDNPALLEWESILPPEEEQQ